jgi:osmoprotectant transport system ATP-binding protein
MTPCVEFRGVSKRFAEKEVLQQVSVNCPAGQTTAIVGASGSGKTTLLQLVNGVLSPDAGEVCVFGERVPENDVEHFRRGIGYAVQGAALFPHMTGRQNVTLVAGLEGWSETKMEERLLDLLQQMDLPQDVADRLPRELSGGQQQRLGLCRALMLKPKLLLLDEPFSAVDPITRVEIYDRFSYVKEHEGVSSLLVTHDLREARRLAEYLVILHDGSVQQHGGTSDVLNEPANDYVRSLVESQLS